MPLAVNGIQGQPPTWLSLLVCVTLAAAVAAVHVRSRPGRLLAPCLYGLGLVGLGYAEVIRGFWPVTFFLWGATCDLAGYALVAAIVGWGSHRISATRSGPSPAWFSIAQACLSVTAASMAVWLATDVRFEGLGEGVALMGLTGRMAACPAALMIIGASIVMSWQTHGRWRAAWQYMAMVSGILFTGSVGWARLDVTALAISDLWFYRAVSLLISFSMMTLLTSVGLGRVLPRNSDWIARGRRASPIFGCFAATLLAIVLAISLWRFVAAVV